MCLFVKFFGRAQLGLLSVVFLLNFFFSAASATSPDYSQGVTEPKVLRFPNGNAGAVIRYGYELLANTPIYLGPKGTVGSYAKNKMACRNCHMDVGTRPYGNSLLDSQTLYPQFRKREGKIQTLVERTNVCIEHNLQGKPLPANSPEMQAILMYYRWISKGRPVLEDDPDQRMVKLAFLSRAADPEKGKAIYESKCVVCHANNGMGKLNPSGSMYIFPPLWGNESFAVGASMSRLSIMARFVKGNMPYNTATPESPTLTDEESWDVSAFVLSQKRPAWKGSSPFPNLAEKPYDFPLPPFADSFPFEQHLLGPFQPIVDYWISIQGPRAAESAIGI